MPYGNTSRLLAKRRFNASCTCHLPLLHTLASWWNHIYVKPLYEPHPDKYDESGKESHSQCRLDSFVHAKKYSAECAEEITRRIAEIVARDLWPITIVEGMISSIF